MSSTTPEVVPHSYIVVFKSDTDSDKCDSHCRWAHERHSQRISALGAEGQQKYHGIKHHYKFTDGLRGYAGTFDESLKSEIEATDEVDFVEPDLKVYTRDVVTQSGAPSWGLARISHRKLTGGTESTYLYDSSAGTGTRAYVIDTGVLAGHKDFGGRAKFGHNAVPGSANTDKNGHGTHVSGTIGGTKYGVAKKTNIIGVKVLGDDGSGSNSTVIAGLNWAADDAASAGASHTSVVNMSLGGGYSKALNMVVAAVVRRGMTVCVAAGNDNEDSRNSSPASEKTAVTVGATTNTDDMASFSDYGPLVDIFAPGQDITSAWIDKSGGGSLTNTNTISGTSMATPHVTGLCAYLIALEGLDGGAAQVTKRLKGLASRGLITGLPDQTVNALAYNGVQASDDGEL